MKKKIIITEEQLKYLVQYVSLNEQEIPSNVEGEELELTPEEDNDLSVGVDQIGEKMISDLGQNKVLTNVKDSKTLNGIASSFLLSKLVPTDFDQDPNKYKFTINPITNVNGTQSVQLGNLENLNEINYRNISGTMIKTNMDNIINEINSENQKNFTSGVKLQYILATENVKLTIEGTSKLVKILSAKSTTSENLMGRDNKYPKLIILSKGIFEPSLVAPEGSEVKTTLGGKEFEKEGGFKILKIKGGTVNPKDSKFNFVVNTSNLTPESVKNINNEIKNVVQQELVSRFGDKSSEYKAIMNGLTIISSASNKYGSVVTPTHDNNGNPTGNDYNKPINNYVFNGKKITTNQPGSNPKANWKLAEDRGKTLSEVVINNIKTLGIDGAETIIPKYDIRITDTGGNIDENLGGTGLNPGQFAEINISLDFEKIIRTPPSKGAAAGFTQFMIYLVPVSGQSSPNKKSNWTWARGKYLKSGLIDKLFGKSGGTAKRRGSGGTNWLMKNTKFSGRVSN